MNVLLLIDGDTGTRILLSLAHSLWLGLGIALVEAVLIGTFARHATPAMRHNTYLVALLLVAASPAVAYLFLADRTVVTALGEGGNP